MSKAMSVFAKNLSKIRKSRGYTQEQLAELADVSLSTITYYETKRAWPSRESLGSLAKTLKVNEVEFFRDDPSRFDPDNIPVLTREQLKKLIPTDLAMEIISEALGKKAITRP